MRQIFYFAFFTLSTITIFAQSPGGVANAVLWLKGNTVVTPDTWTDYSGNSNDFTQPTTINQPVLASNVFNFNAALQFNGTSTFMTQPLPSAFPEADANRTIFVVANAGATSGYRWIFVYGSPGSGSSTCQMGNNAGGLSNAFYGPELNSTGYWDAAGNANGALASFTMATSLGTQYDRGNFLNQVTFVPQFATSVNGVIGALSSTPNEVWNGSIGEVIMFTSALVDADRNLVESYLALKYGFTLGTPGTPLDYKASDGTTIYWAGTDGTYQNDVFGIGTDIGTALSQSQSNSTNSGNGAGVGQNATGNLVLSVATPLTDLQFLMMGNDAGALSEHLIASGEAPLQAVGSQRLIRNWKVQNTGAVGAVDLSFDTTGLTLTGGSSLNNFRLMIDQDGDGDYFNTGTQSFVKPVSFTGNKMNFSGITLANNSVFTIITQAASTLPATWLGFTATLDRSAAVLNWKTGDEINVDHYTVEFSSNGVNFTFLGTVAAKNGSGVNTYSLRQENLPSGTRYYRIKRVDKNGTVVMSDIKSVRAGSLSTVILKSNPILKGRIELNIDVPQNQNAVIRVVSLSGKVLVQQQAGLAGGSNAINTNVSHIAAGTYFLQVQLNNEIINKKFVKL